MTPVFLYTSKFEIYAQVKHNLFASTDFYKECFRSARGHQGNTNDKEQLLCQPIKT